VNFAWRFCDMKMWARPQLTAKFSILTTKV
jgi:hypothetical protein